MAKGMLLGKCSLKCQKDGHLEDFISQMPDIILSNILFLLEMREAGRSSVLSRRWRDLWKLTTVLNFDYSETLQLLAGVKKGKDKSARLKYNRWVDQVIELYQLPNLDEFRVNFDFSTVFNSSVDEWVKFSIQKGAKKIEIDFLKHTTNSHRYTLSQECYACFTSPSNKSSLKRLTSLFLRFVNINGQLMQYLLQNCPLLEYVDVWFSDHLVDLQVDAPSLKHLMIFNCSFMESLELSEAPKLRTVEYFGKKLRLLRVGNLPLLSNLYLTSLSDPITYALLPFFNHFSQLETLRLTMRWNGKEEIPEIPQLTNLKRLKLKLVVTSGKSLLNLSKLIEAAPALREFKMEINMGPVDSAAPAQVCPSPRRCLKHVEMVGYSSSENEDQFIEYLLQCATDVQTVIIVPKETSTIARRYAWRLRGLVPPGANFIVK